MDQLDDNRIDQALGLLGSLMEADEAPSMELVVCGGAALCLSGLYRRTTKDVDVVALFDSSSRRFHSPEPLPGPLVHAAHLVAQEMGLSSTTVPARMLAACIKWDSQPGCRTD